MPREVSLLRRFLATPGDLEEERLAVSRVAEELNRSMCRSLNMMVEILKWEHDVFPSSGIDGQQVINDQIRDDYDLLMAIVWSRLGTPTGRAKSGTEEEFDRAYERRKSDPNSVTIMLYFKDAAIEPSRIDIEQKQEVNRFKDRVKYLGVLPKIFREISDFERLVRTDLSIHLQKIAKQLGIMLNQ